MPAAASPPSAGRRMSPAEALMWSVDNEPALRSSFLGLTLLEAPPDPERFRRKMAVAVANNPSLGERVAVSPLDLGPPRWEPDPQFDLDYHVRRLALPAPGSRRQLLDLAALLYADPFDRSRPLWQFTVVEGLEDGRAALLAKMHHVLSDGVGAVRLSVSFLDLSPEGDPEPVPPAGGLPGQDGTEPTSPSRGWTDLALAPARLAGTVGGAVVGAARRPVDGMGATAAGVRSVARQLGVRDPARSPLWGSERSYVHRFDMLSLDLERTRAAAHALGGTVNDAYVTLMAAAAGEYHRALGADVDELRMSMPISVRRDRSVGGNAWVPARVLVPTAAMPLAERFALVHESLARVKTEPGLQLTSGLASVVRRLPPPLLASVARQQTATVDFACSNVRGAPFDLWIGGARVMANHPFGPTAGVAFNATVLSYLGELHLGLNSDTGAVTDPALLRDCITSAATALYSAGGGRRRSR